jgi:hypothetical protein
MTTRIPAAEPLPALLPEYEFRATGTARLVLVINTTSFVDDADADAFRHLRGSEPFAATLRDLRPRPPFLPDAETARLEQDAYDLRIFRSRLRYNHFFPTYRVAWDSSMREALRAAGCDAERWACWTVRARLTRHGLAVITLDRPIEDEPLIRCTEAMLELPAHGGHGMQDQWTLGMTILRAFLEALDRRLVVRLPRGQRVIRFRTTERAMHSLRLDRYVVHWFRRITRDGELMPTTALKRDYAQLIAAFMEGSLVECDGLRRFPEYAAEPARALLARDVATWEEELCLFTGESALIYSPLLGRGMAYVGGPMGLDAHAYTNYWAGIIRGVEHLVAFRSEVQQAERRTSTLLGRIPALTRAVNDGRLTAHELAEIDHLAAGLSDIFDGLPEQRSMAISAAAFRADYVRRKFEVLMRELDVQPTLDLVNTNVEQLSFFLSYYGDMRLQWEGQRTNSLGLGLGAVVLFMAISSFLADTFNVLDRLFSPTQTERDQAIRNLVLAIVIGLVVAACLVVVVRIAWKRRSRVREPV